jgi:protein-serine/threonine kinase
MDIRFKSKPKVSTVNILDDCNFQIKEFEDNTDIDHRPVNPTYFPDDIPNATTTAHLPPHLSRTLSPSASDHTLPRGLTVPPELPSHGSISNASGHTAPPLNPSKSSPGSRPSVTSNLSTQLADSSQQTRPTKSILSSQLQNSRLEQSDQNKFKLKRIYSESETSNFDDKTGHRLYDDGKLRPHISRSNSILSDENDHNHPFISQDDNALFGGIEDEYIPGLDFANLLYQWNNRSDQNISERSNSDNNFTTFPEKHTSRSTTTSHSNTPSSRDASYLDLNKLHASVAPQPIKSRRYNAGKFSYSKLSEYMKLRNPNSLVEAKSEATSPTTTTNMTKNALSMKPSMNDSTTTLTSPDTSKNDGTENDHKSKRRKSSVVDPNTGDVNYESILSSLPENFNDLPYSQRKRLVTSFSDSIDYSQFSLFAKSYLQENANSFNSFRTSKSGGSSNNNSFVRRPRCSSVNTLAGRLLQMSSTDLKKLQEKRPVKTNVDEKGAIVMGHELGKVIGFGAWGTIRECTDRHATVRAIKIVKSVRDDSTPSPRSTPNSIAKNNPKVLEVFRKEIKIWKELHHPHILPLLKSLETETAIFCITNRIYGGTLFDLVASWGVFNGSIMNTCGDLEFLVSSQDTRLQEVAKCSLQIIDALKYMHDKGIVHGDLKLENVLVENKDKEHQHFKLILCDFGMSRFFNTRNARRASIRLRAQVEGDEEDEEDDGTLYIRSKSSVTERRKPYEGGESVSTKNLKFHFNDDSKIGVSNLEKLHGPSLQSVDLAPTNSWRKSSLLKLKDNHEASEIGIDSDLPHSHIGSLPYASPELLSPSPPPLGPLADIWALGVLVYTMCVGKLPFQHQYEPRLRAIITAGKFNRHELAKSCLLEWILRMKEDADDKEDKLPENLSFQSPSLFDTKRQKALEDLLEAWKQYCKCTPKKYLQLYNTILGSLELNITKRWDLQTIHDHLSQFSG